MVSIVIPAYNEEKRILPTLEAYKEGLKIPHELIVVVNGTTDNTIGVVRSFIQKNPQYPVRVIQEEKLGKGLAVIKGLREAKGEIVGFIDADLATPISDTEKILTILSEKKVDGVIASRLKPGSIIHDRGALRLMAGKVFAAVVRFVTDLEFYDTQCGAKFFTRQGLSKILPHITAIDMTIDVDLLLASEKEGVNVYEMPSEWYDRSSSAMLGSFTGFIASSLRMFVNVIRLQKKYITHA